MAGFGGSAGGQADVNFSDMTNQTDGVEKDLLRLACCSKYRLALAFFACTRTSR